MGRLTKILKLIARHMICLVKYWWYENLLVSIRNVGLIASPQNKKALIYKKKSNIELEIIQLSFGKLSQSNTCDNVE